MSSEADGILTIDRREAIRRVSALLGGVAFVGGSSLLAACSKERAPVAAGEGAGTFSATDIAFLDEVAETILPATNTPGAKAAQVGAFMALMVTDTYEPKDQAIFRDGMKKLDEASQKANSKSFMDSTPEARLALLESLDREAKAYMDAREKSRKAAESATPPASAESEKKKADAVLPDRKSEAGNEAAVPGDAPTHYFRMMKELACLGYFTSEIGYTQAMRYIEAPGRFDPCIPYQAGEKSWAPHA